MKRLFHMICCVVAAIVGVPALSSGEDVGSLVAIRGRAALERQNRTLEAKVKDGIMINDAVSTKEASKAKMLFVDDSVLTLGERSRVVVKEFLSGKGKGDRAIFNLIDGKMRSVVGRSGFEVHTPTAVAAARGTVILFETGYRDGKRYTTILCLEGVVEISSSDPGISGSVVLTAGYVITIIEGEPLPVPTLATGEERDRLLRETDMGDFEISIPGPVHIELRGGIFSIDGWPDLMPLPPLDQQPVNATTPVTIEVIFP